LQNQTSAHPVGECADVSKNKPQAAAKASPFLEEIPVNAKSSSGCLPFMMDAIERAEPQECVQPSVPWPVFKYRFGILDKPM
jgi:hypothetical protein